MKYETCISYFVNDKNYTLHHYPLQLLIR